MRLSHILRPLYLTIGLLLSQLIQTGLITKVYLSSRFHSDSRVMDSRAAGTMKSALTMKRRLERQQGR